jgi:hypothetical protein
MKLEYWFPVLTLVAGWFLNELSYLVRLRREERKPFAKAIADLLEIRHRIRGASAAIAEVKKHFLVPADAELAVRRFLQDFILQTEPLRERYNEAVDLIASVDPILAFRLRSKDEFPSYLQKLRPLLDNDNQMKAFVTQIEDKLSSAFVDHLEESMMELAKAHGVNTWWRLRKRFARREEMPTVFDEILSVVQEREPGAGP